MLEFILESYKEIQFPGRCVAVEGEDVGVRLEANMLQFIREHFQETPPPRQNSRRAPLLFP